MIRNKTITRNKRVIHFSIFIISMLCLIYCIGCRKSRKNDQYDDKNNLIKTTFYSDEGAILFDREYNQAGIVICEQHYNPNGSNAFIYNYDETGILKIYTHYSEEGKPVYSYHYDHALNIVKEVYYSPDQSILYYYIIQYNESGNKTRISFFNGNDQLQHYTLLTYGSNTTLTSRNKFTAQDNPVFAYTFDGKGNTIIYQEFDNTGQIQYSEEYNSQLDQERITHYQQGKREKSYEIDKENELIIHTDYNRQGKKVTLHEYSKSGNEKRRINYNNSGKIVTSIDYDEKGREIKRTNYDAKGIIKNYIKYEYNRKGALTGVNMFDASGDPIEYY